MRPSLILAVGLLASAPLAARAGEILNIGDPAPPLKVARWVKGEPIARFEPGRIYVVEFWATWCAPCRESIPHLTELARKYRERGVRFVGVDVWEDDPAAVGPFLAEMGPQMDYAVALDDVPPGVDSADGATAAAWLKAAQEDAIPTAFVVRDGKLAWIGLPMELDEPLAAIVAGTDVVGNRPAERLAEKRREAERDAERQRVAEAFQRRDYPATLLAIAGAEARHPDLADEFAATRFAALCNGGTIVEGLKLGETLVRRHFDDADELNDLLWQVVDPDLANPVDPRIAQLALRGMRRAVELNGEDAATLDTLAAAHYRAGDPQAALATEEKARRCLTPQAIEQDRDLPESIERCLARYRKAAAARPGPP